jgi:hypothetical protein
VIETPQNTTAMRLVASQSAPVTEELALPRIQQFLGNQRASEAVASDFKQLKAKAKISYQGDFASAEGAVPAAEAKKPEPAATATSEKPKADASMEKGVAGLK